jgi:hypothetical protein
LSPALGISYLVNSIFGSIALLVYLKISYEFFDPAVKKIKQEDHDGPEIAHLNIKTLHDKNK